MTYNNQPQNAIVLERMDNQNDSGDIYSATPIALLSMDNLPYDLKFELLLAAELYSLRILYPAQTRKFTEREVERTNYFWAQTFAGVDLRLFHKAIVSFIKTDRSGFFPYPGKIMGILEDIIAEEEAESGRLAAARERIVYAEHQRRVERGENCSTCRFCEHRQVKRGKYDEIEITANGINDNITKLFCQNPKSYKFEGNSGYGTAAAILCDYYEPLESVRGDVCAEVE